MRVKVIDLSRDFTLSLPPFSPAIHRIPSFKGAFPLRFFPRYVINRTEGGDTGEKRRRRGKETKRKNDDGRTKRNRKEQTRSLVLECRGRVVFHRVFRKRTSREDLVRELG